MMMRSWCWCRDCTCDMTIATQRHTTIISVDAAFCHLVRDVLSAPSTHLSGGSPLLLAQSAAIRTRSRFGPARVLEHYGTP